MKNCLHKPVVWLTAAMLTAAVCVAAGQEQHEADNPAEKQPADNLEYWLEESEQADEQPTDQNGDAAADDAQPQDSSEEESSDPQHALPAVIELSDGTVVAGMIYTSADAPLEVYVEDEKRWRRVPPAAALSIEAVVVEEKMELQWRWAATGSPEKVYTGRKYPTRRLEWKITIADGSEITGVIKGRSLRILTDEGSRGPFLLAERTKGPVDSTLDELVYLKRVVISRRAMEKVQAAEM